eukprot:GHVS01040039.1.p1 GENE.GHVS01040039.1~~GHVS01040039.1.p1  ORF type:complete len:261 (+),score=31.69 GHVS01040039.1:131-913(+)
MAPRSAKPSSAPLAKPKPLVERRGIVRKLIAIKSWGLSEWSTLASVLCAIDCTVLPALMTVVPLLGWASPHSMHSLHHFSHWAAIYVMVPLALLAIISNFLRLRSVVLSLWGLFGAALVFVAHQHDILLLLPPQHHSFASFAQSWHTAISLFGAANIILSNYISHQRLHQSHSCCSHNQHHHRSTHATSTNIPVKYKREGTGDEEEMVEKRTTANFIPVNYKTAEDIKMSREDFIPLVRGDGSGSNSRPRTPVESKGPCS